MSRPINRLPARQEIMAVLGLVTLAAAPHFLNLGIWISAYFAATLLLCFIAFSRGRYSLPKGLLPLLTAIGLVTVALNHTYATTHKSGVALLVIMLGLKLLELKQKRDIYVIIFITYFVLITQFLFNQSMAMTGYLLVVVAGLVLVQLSISRNAPLLFSHRSVRTTTSLLLQSIPVAIVLFLFFPRFIGPLWNLGLDQNTGRTGLSDSITPGSISNLIRSPAIAFRVEFEGQPPPQNQLYWRGPVLWTSDGYRWSRSRSIPTEALAYQASGNPLNYQVTLEPSSKRWLFALDLPASSPARSRVTEDFQILSYKKIDQRYRYAISSHLVYNTGPITSYQRQAGLQLPNNITPRMRSLVSQWQTDSHNQAALVNTALSYFREQPFFYTLRPPLLESNPIDQFLFESRRGFCEHYATSFVTLMRIAGIPSRVVTGYQGGELNPMGDYLIVRQSDAHAWAEVWLQGRGWVRVDPTAMVAPERVERSFDVPFDTDISIGTPIRFDIPQTDYLRDLLKQAQLAYDMVNTTWNQWVLGYSSDRQNRMMDLLGLEFFKGAKIGIGMVLGVLLALIVLSYWIWTGTLEKISPVQRYYLGFCKKLAAKGVVRHRYEGPMDFAVRVTSIHPEWRLPVYRIINSYIRLRYRPDPDKQALQQFKTQVRSFRP